MIEAPTLLTFPSPSPYRETGLLPFAFGDTEDEPASRRILIVDDEDCVRELFADYLRESYECKTASTADQALRELASQPYALVISDMMMPGRNGVELLREIT